MVKFEVAEFTPPERKSIEEMLSEPMFVQQLLQIMEVNDFRNFLFMPLPMLRTQK
jgi:hypothetical protein